VIPLTSSYSEFVAKHANRQVQLAPLYVDDQAVVLPDQPRPLVSAVVSASGKRPAHVQVVRLKNRSDASGSPIHLSEEIDRTIHVDSPVYLRCFDIAV
jgi:hypothetical protein